MNRRKPPPNRHFHGRFLAALDASGLSQSALANKLGLDKSTVSRWVAGIGQPMASVWPGLATALNVSVLHLFGGSGATEASEASAALDRERVLTAENARLRQELAQIYALLDAAKTLRDTQATGKHRP